ncbi:iron ABC transporter [Vibrio sp. 10N.286.49.B3]|uniref:ABC transporter ATP-binding protein n=1 Tax=Vibrio sp. 10N.286.49.B3 TaxID=1880855 RepID=UPI000C852936|nr:ATP-binding cassette domain-containing protein [Vibrio sp. 10N.286.49.B3]PMH44559.1 iron ABC transporter [Vibrio sp. 10N.286.49.B3]
MSDVILKKPQLTVSGLCYQAGAKTLLNNISLEINSGELVGIIGPNGAGKSTLMKCLSGFQTLTHGEVALQGKPLHKISHIERARCMSYLPQYNEAAFPFSVAETISLGFHAQQQQAFISPKTIQSQITQALRQLGIEHLRSRSITELSGGEKQLVHFARLLVQDTPLLLLDEPTASLDIGHESQLMNVLAKACQQGKSALVAIHNLNTAAEFCDRLILINHGEVMADGHPSDVLSQQNIHQLYQDKVMVTRHPVTGNAIISPYKQ